MTRRDDDAGDDDVDCAWSSFCPSCCNSSCRLCTWVCFFVRSLEWRNHCKMHIEWYKCPHGNRVTIWPGSISSAHTAHVTGPMLGGMLLSRKCSNCFSNAVISSASRSSLFCDFFGIRAMTCSMVGVIGCCGLAACCALLLLLPTPRKLRILSTRRRRRLRRSRSRLPVPSIP